MIFKDKLWIQEVLEILGDQALIPCLVGSDLEELYYSRNKSIEKGTIYLALLLND
jgi:hypothetical protein